MQFKKFSPKTVKTKKLEYKSINSLVCLYNLSDKTVFSKVDVKLDTFFPPFKFYDLFIKKNLRWRFHI